MAVNNGFILIVGSLTFAIGWTTTAAGQESGRSASPRAPSYPEHARLLVVRDGDDRERPVVSRADWEVRRAHILAHFQQVAGPLPGGERRVPLAMEVVSTQEDRGIVRKKITFATEPGDRVPAWLLIPGGPAAAESSRPAVLCLHQTVSIGKDEPAGLGGKPDLRYALELARRGYVALAPDYPNFGEYKIDVYKLGYASATMKAIWNNRRAVDVLTDLNEVDPERIGVIGHSLGGHNAIFTALFEPRIKAVVSSCGFNAFPSYDKGNIAGWSHKGYMPRLKETYQLDLRLVPFDFPELIGALAPRAFFTNSPLHDANFEVEGVRLCIGSARPVYEFLGVPDRLVATYPDAQHAFPPAARFQAYEFLDEHLRRAR
jgi:dienelactone hydrolase